MEEEPIYNFDGLKRLLTSMGYIVEAARTYREIDNVDIDINDIRNNISFTDNGIFLTLEDGSQQQIFLYKRNYRLLQHGKPRFHIRNCTVIRSFIASGSFEREYRRANTNDVMVCDIDDGYIDKVVQDLPLCKYCARIALISDSMDSSNFVEILRSANEASKNDTTENQEVDIFGYTKRWSEISEAYRTQQNYTCERCGIEINDVFDRHFMHVHHINGNKTDNRTANLECLCVKCHANVDDTHRNNFSSRANQLILTSFEEKYSNNYNSQEDDEDNLPF